MVYPSLILCQCPLAITVQRCATVKIQHWHYGSSAIIDVGNGRRILLELAPVVQVSVCSLDTCGAVTVRMIKIRRTRDLEARLQAEFLLRPLESRVQRTHSVNFGVRALDSNETPVEAGIVDSESLRALSPAPRWSRVSSPMSAGGRKGSDSTISSIIGLAESNDRLRLPRRPFANHKRSSSSGSGAASTSPSTSPELLGDPGPSFRPSRPLSAQNNGTSAASGQQFHTAPSTPNPYEILSSQHLQVPSTNPVRPVSTNSIDSMGRPLKGILKNRNSGQFYGITRRGNVVTGVSPPNNRGLSPEPSPLISSLPETIQPRSSSAPPQKTIRFSQNPSGHGTKGLSGIPESEGPHGNELREHPRQRSTENLPSLAGTSVAIDPSSFIVPHPTRTAPKIPFLQSPSPAPSSSTPDLKSKASDISSNKNGVITSKKHTGA
ncbi:hypothetical protein H072_5382 [Dactylellina haptotyla CBS 200.50]|uniref:Uncharacterized protein n=1 Tax=Dactylellina haptotyla (strain CBS 200.50) TaxID=1284197 RepID=S8AHY5_DACHA|nr:hypothetical protein H072_5382 [Dactylellina haptotyla CBS 200.50]